MKDILAKNLTGDFKIFNNNEETFSYDCIQCGNCCKAITVTIDPYDVLRLKEKLNINTTEIMKHHLNIMQEAETGWPTAFLRAAQTAKCEFNINNRCIVWQHRPKVCRLFPLGMASSVEEGKKPEMLFYLLKRTGVCKGFDENKEQSVQEWLDSSGLQEYTREYEIFTSIKYKLLSGYDFNSLDQQRLMMLSMPLYDFDGLFSLLVPQVKDIAATKKLNSALKFFEWLVSEIVPDKSGILRATMLFPEMPREVFFGALEKKLLEIISGISN